MCYYVKIYGPIGLDLSCIGTRLLCLSASLQEWTTVSEVLGSATKYSDSESFCCGMKTSFYLIKIPWTHDSRGITRSHFPWYQTVADLVYIVYCLVCHAQWWRSIGHNMSIVRIGRPKTSRNSWSKPETTPNRKDEQRKVSFFVVDQWYW